MTPGTHFNTIRLALGATALTLIGSAASADIIHADDVIINGGSLCIGFDCVNGESFGFDTLRLKENNLRIHFDDTSTSASFPSNDWRIVANDTSNGGANKFSIEDATGGRTPFTIEAGAPNHSLYVDDAGRLGLGTNTPVTDIHVKSGNTPTLRLEQDGSSGFTPQTWDVAGNEANFFVRDATSGSTLPFRIFPGAPSNALAIEGSTGDVGLGTTSPTAPLHVKRTNNTGSILVEDTGTSFNVQMELRKANTPRIRFDNTTVDVAPSSGNNLPAEWDIGLDANQNFIMRSVAKNANVFILSDTGNLTLTGGLISTSGGGACTVADPCDAVFDPAVYTVPSIEDHAAIMWDNKFLPAVGPTGPGMPINVTEKMLRMLNELETAHIYIEQLNAQLQVQGAAIDALKTRITQQ